MHTLIPSKSVIRYPIQTYGYLLTTTIDQTILGVSERFDEVLGAGQSEAFLGRKLDSFLHKCHGNYADKIMAAIDEVSGSKSPRKLILHPFGKKTHYLFIYIHDNLLYLEWEEQHRKSISADEMNEIGFLFEKEPVDIWSSLCRSIEKLIEYDRVMVFQVVDGYHGKIVAERAKDNNTAFIGKEFSAAFMPQDIIDYYRGRSFLTLPILRPKSRVLLVFGQMSIWCHPHICPFQSYILYICKPSVSNHIYHFR